jgi:hypothetical protein
MVIEILMYILGALSGAGMLDQILVCMCGSGIWTKASEKSPPGTGCVSAWRWITLAMVNFLWVVSERARVEPSTPFWLIPAIGEVFAVWMLSLMLFHPPRRSILERASAAIVILIVCTAPLSIRPLGALLNDHQAVRSMLPFIATGILSFTGRVHQLLVMHRSRDYGRLTVLEALLTGLETFVWMLYSIIQMRLPAAVACLLVTGADLLRLWLLLQNREKREEFINGLRALLAGGFAHK